MPPLPVVGATLEDIANSQRASGRGLLRSANLGMIQAASELLESASQIGRIVIDACQHDGTLDTHEELIRQVGCRDVRRRKRAEHVDKQRPQVTRTLPECVRNGSIRSRSVGGEAGQQATRCPQVCRYARSMLEEALGAAPRIGFRRIGAGGQPARPIGVVVFQCREPQRFLAVEEMIEAAFAEARLAYDFIHARRRIAVAEHQPLGGAHELLASVDSRCSAARSRRSRVACCASRLHHW